MNPRLFDLLLALVKQAGELLSKEALIQEAWHGAFVSDNTLTQAVSRLRSMREAPEFAQYLETVPRHGYRFAERVVHEVDRHTDAQLHELLEPHRALIDGRAALGSLSRDQVERARACFEPIVGREPANAAAHVGLANVYLLQFDVTRADAAPNTGALMRAASEAREACRLDPAYAEAWITLGWVLARTGDIVEALAALRRGIELEPDNWRHQLRLAYSSWGEERLRAARRTLELWPGLPAAHWLAASVFIARNATGLTDREVDAGLAAVPEGSTMTSRVSVVGLNWLKGLLSLAREADDDALASFDREIALESTGHIYARECAAQAWYAKAVVLWRRRDLAGAQGACAEAIARAPRLLMPRVALALITGDDTIDLHGDEMNVAADRSSATERAFAHAARLVHRGRVGEAARLVLDAVGSERPGNAGWLLAIEPLLMVWRDKPAWDGALVLLRSRAGEWLAPEGI